jgi:hypothetical protein
VFNVLCFMSVKCPDGPRNKAVVQSVGSAIQAPVPPTRGQ